MLFLAETFRQFRMKYRIDTIMYNVVDLFKRTKKVKYLTTKTIQIHRKKDKTFISIIEIDIFLIKFL